MKPDETTSLTLAELGAYLDGVYERRQDESRLALWAAWHAAAFQRGKKLPDINDILRRMSRQPVKQQSSQDIMKAFEMAFVGHPALAALRKN